MPEISVVCVLHENLAPERHVERLAAQSVVSDMEVVLVEGWHVVDSGPPIRRAMERLAGRLELRYLDLPPRGRAACWNAGIAATTAPLVLLLGDDFFAGPGLVGEHLRLHRERPEENVAGLGPGIFPDYMQVSPFMRWLEDEGKLYGVSFTRVDLEAMARFFYGANTSLKRSFLERVGPFQEAFPYHGWDDFEMGERLFGAGMEIAWLPDARADHEHPITLGDRRAVMGESGESAVIYERFHPGRHIWHDVVEVPAWRLAMSAVKRRLAHLVRRDEASLGRHYNAALNRAFARGYRRALVGRPSPATPRPRAVVGAAADR
ncbi:MAG: glycosyltransferase family 2 protein [Actinobacteria bacterium]|nr:glycosyltransferase family 2 protein [Actinomycetota bacterium]